MVVRIAHDAPGGNPLRRVGRGVAVLLGLLLLIAGLVAAVLPLLYVMFAVSSLLGDGSDLPTVDSDNVPAFAIACATAVVAPFIGLRLIRGRRRLGLFLRKFGLSETTRTVTYALATAVGRSVRMVTLDDAMVSPLGVSRGRRPAFWIMTIVALAGAGLGLRWFFGGGLDEWIRQGAEEAAGQVEGANIAEEIIGSIVAAMIGAILAALVAMIVVLIPVAFAIGVTIFGGGSVLAARRSERAATRSIQSESAIPATARSIARRSRRILGPQLVVVKVASGIWQQAVRALAVVADVVVIDVSQPTENLLWEVATMRNTLGRHWVLVGARDQVARLAGPSALPPGSAERRLAETLDGEEILVYGTGRSEQRRFARALRNRLGRVASQR